MIQLLIISEDVSFNESGEESEKEAINTSISKEKVWMDTSFGKQLKIRTSFVEALRIARRQFPESTYRLIEIGEE